MIQNIGDQFGLILTLPVYRTGVPLDTVEQRRAAFRGCVRGVFRMGDLLASAWQSVPVVGVETMILDPTALNPTNRFILFHSSRISAVRAQMPTESEFRAGRHYEATLRLAARTWTFLFRPVPDWWSTQFTWLPYSILASGLCATLFMVGYVRDARKRTEAIEDAVDERTAALSHEVAERRRAEKELRQTQNTLVLAQRIGRVGSWESDLVRKTLSWSDETFRIFGREPGKF